MVFLKLFVNFFACIQAKILFSSFLPDFSSLCTLPFDKVKVLPSANNNVLHLVTEDRSFVESKKG